MLPSRKRSGKGIRETMRIQKEIRQLDGDKGMLAVCTKFYDKVFEDPVMGVLFDDHEEPHAWRLAAFFVRQYGGDDTYSQERGHGFHSLFVNHHKGMRCPKRGKDKNTSFTVTHRELWLKFMQEACDEVGLSEGATEMHMDFCSHAMNFYGPFWDDRKQVAALRARIASTKKKHASSNTSTQEAKAASGGCPVHRGAGGGET